MTRFTKRIAWTTLLAAVLCLSLSKSCAPTAEASRRGEAYSTKTRGPSAGRREWLPRDIPGITLWLRGDLGITLGGTPLASGTSPSVVTLTGTLTKAIGLQLEIDSVAGGTARGQATFKYSADNGSTYIATGVATASTVSLSGAASGITANFPTGTYRTDQKWKGTVTKWSDQSGAGHDFNNNSGSPGREAVFKTSVIGGRPGLTFDGSNDFLVGANASSFITASAYTYVVVFNATSITTNSANTYANASLLGNGPGAYTGIPLKSAPAAFAYNFTATDDKVSASISTGADTLVMTRHSGGVIGIRVNGGSEATASSGNTGALNNVMEIARGVGTDADCYNGSISEIIISNAFISDTQRLQLQAYVRGRYGIATP